MQGRTFIKLKSKIMFWSSSVDVVAGASEPELTNADHEPDFCAVFFS